MTAIKTTGLALGFVGAMALGVWIGPSLTSHGTSGSASVALQEQTPPRAASAAGSLALSAVPATSPELGARLKPVLNEGTDLEAAAHGFGSGEQFAAVAHAAQNTGVPFVVLKERVVDQHKSLAAAIRESKPAIDASREANRAMVMARGDVAAVVG